jgi:hypothetical protein
MDVFGINTETLVAIGLEFPRAIAIIGCQNFKGRLRGIKNTRDV